MHSIYYFIVIIIIFFVIFFVIFFLYKELEYYNLKTFNIINSFTKINSFATLNKKVHYQMIDLLPKNISPNKQLKILEIGAGDGNSTLNFIDKLNKNKIHFDYFANEYYDKYKDDLIKILPKEKIMIMSFEDIKDKFDIILLTCASSLNDNNIKALKNLTTPDTIIITIYPYIFKNMSEKYFKIYKYERCSYILGIYLVKIH